MKQTIKTIQKKKKNSELMKKKEEVNGVYR